MWWRTMWDGEGVYYPQVELVSLLSAFRRPWRQAGPLAVLGIWNARKTKGKGWLVGRWVGLSRGPKEEQYYGGGWTGK